MTTKTKKPKVRLSGKDGNVFYLMGLCSNALKKAGQKDKSIEMVKKITSEAKSYDEAIQIMADYCEVS